MLVKPEDASAPQSAQFPLSFVEFVSLIALLMAITSLSIDIMLPALPEIGYALGVTGENDRQYVISIYFVGFAAGQFLFGPLSDRYGRKLPLLAGVALYLVGTVLALTSGTFPQLLMARVIQGLGAAAPRVIALAIIRDRFQGREMSRIMSFVMMVFIIVPILAPSIGEGLLQLASWRMIFGLLLLAATLAMIWASMRLPETRPAGDRLPLSAAALRHAFRLVLSTRQTLGYVVAMGFIFGLLVSYIISAEQVFVDTYGLGTRFPIVFGAISCFMIAASIVNASAVRRIGMRNLSHRALLGALAACGVLALMGYPDKPPLLLFCGFMAAIFFCFGLIMPNFNSLALEPMGRIAGTASSLAGFYSTAAAALLGGYIGRSFDGGVRPLCLGITILILLTLAVVLVTERFRLMQGKAPAAAKIPH